MTISIIGIDCATQANKVGLARGYLGGDGLVVDRLAKPGPGQTVAAYVSEWVSKDRGTLFAIDAPLGWPADLGQSLDGHLAGGHIGVPSNTLFRRETDRFVKRKTGKQPLDVGADRIARTAHAALHYLDEIRRLLNQPVPLAWQPSLTNMISAIEVYPAATLKQSGYRNSGYKGRDQIEQRAEIVDSISAEIDLRIEREAMLQDDDMLDAVVCILAGCHFLNGFCHEPEDMTLARKEGWIWVRRSVD